MPTFEELMKQALERAKIEPGSDYWRGYIRGLCKGHYGRDISSSDELGDGYRNGHGDGYFAGLLADLEKESN
jgi:hypothetical protein